MGSNRAADNLTSGDLQRLAAGGRLHQNSYSARALLQVLLARHLAPRVLEGASHMTGNAALFLFVVGLELGSHYIVLTRLELAR